MYTGHQLETFYNFVIYVGKKENNLKTNLQNILLRFQHFGKFFVLKRVYINLFSNFKSIRQIKKKQFWVAYFHSRLEEKHF